MRETIENRLAQSMCPMCDKKVDCMLNFCYQNLVNDILSAFDAYVEGVEVENPHILGGTTLARLDYADAIQATKSAIIEGVR